MNEADQISEQHGAKAGDDAQAERQQGELRQRQLAALLALHHACRRCLFRHFAPFEAIRPNLFTRQAYQR